MKAIKIADMTLVLGKDTLSFKEKIEIARHLDNLKVDSIDMPEIENVATDTLLIRTISAFIKNSTISVSTGITVEGVELASTSIAKAKNGKLKLCIPVSTVQMEYTCHKKPAKLLELAEQLFAVATEKCKNVELFAIDATRADMAFFKKLVDLAVKFGIKEITLCDDEGIMLPDEFTNYIKGVKEQVPSLEKVNLGILCKNTNSMSTANALMAIKSGISHVKTCVGYDDLTQTKTLANIICSNGAKINASISLNCHELQRIIGQIEWIIGVSKGANVGKADLVSSIEKGGETPLDKNDTQETVTKAVKSLGYDLSDEDYAKVYNEFIRVASRKTVGLKELDAIVANVALQVPPTYTLQSYLINNGNLISSSAQITLLKKGEEVSGISMGNGPIEAAFKALEQIIGAHFELDDFQIQSVTEGREAMGMAVVKLRHNGKLFSGNGISTDVIGSSIRAYINAVNKIVYEEN